MEKKVKKGKYGKAPFDAAAQIADFFFANPTATRGDVLANFGKLWQASTRTIDRLIAEAKAINEQRVAKQEAAKPDALPNSLPNSLPKCAKDEQAGGYDAKVVGRPTKYAPEYADIAFRLSLLGMTDGQMAKFFEVAHSTLSLWKLEHEEFSDALKKGKEYADGKVASALFTKAVDGDVTAQIFWLKNRQPGLWRDRQTQLLALQQLPAEPSLTREELSKLIEKL